MLDELAFIGAAIHEPIVVHSHSLVPVIFIHFANQMLRACFILFRDSHTRSVARDLRSDAGQLGQRPVRVNHPRVQVDVSLV